MRPITSKFEIRREEVNQHDYFNKLINERAFFEVFPNVIDTETLEPARRQIAASSRGSIIDRDGTLMRVFERNARVENTSARYVRWEVEVGEGDIRASIVKNNLNGAITEFGKGGTIFELGLDTDWFGPNDIIILEDLREIPLLVRSEPQYDGTAYIYELAILSDDDRDYLTIEDFEKGKRIIQTGSLIGEATSQRGNVHFGEGHSILEFEVPLTRMGWKMVITDDAQMASKNYRLIDRGEQAGEETLGQPNTPDVLWNELEMKFMAATNRQVDLWLTYGRAAGRFSSKFLDGMTENKLQTGPGLFEFLESSYRKRFPISGFTLDIFQDFLPTVWDDVVEPENQIVDIYTGKGGLKLWQEACAKKDISGVIQLPDQNYADDEPLFQGRHGVTLNAKQYRSIFLDPFGLIRVHHLPFLDSKKVETRTYNNLPITSYQFIIFNYGLGDGRDSNIYIVRNEQAEQWGYAVGTWGPLGPTMNNPGRFHAGLGLSNQFQYLRETMFGMVVKDPSYMVWYTPNLV